MRAIRVRYTVKPGYVETNKERVLAVMRALREQGVAGVHYSCHLEGEGRSFVHLAILADPEDNPLPRLPEFAAFRQGLAGNHEAPPESQECELVGANFDVA